MKFKKAKKTNLPIVMLIGTLLAACGETGREDLDPLAPSSSTRTKAPNSDAAQCLDDFALVPGTRYTLEYESVRADMPAGTKFTTDTEVIGPAIFQSVNATKVKVVFREGVLAAENYSFVGAEGLTSLFYGGSAQVSLPGDTWTANTLNAPPARFRYDLAEGESFTHNYDVVSTTLDGSSSELTDTAAIRQTVTFVGIESVTVPAGTFDACKFTVEEVVTTSGEASKSTWTANWVAVSSGIAIRSEAPSAAPGGAPTVIALVSGQVNGRAIVPDR